MPFYKCEVVIQISDKSCQWNCLHYFVSLVHSSDIIKGKQSITGYIPGLYEDKAGGYTSWHKTEIWK